MAAVERRMRNTKRESGVDHHRWIISYADFITLLFAFFVVMYSISQVNASKYRVFSDSLKETFAVDQHTPKNNDNPISVTLGSKGRSILNGGDGLLDGSKTLDVKRLEEELQKISEQLSIVQDNIQLSGNEERVEINLNANILFAVGDAEPNYAAEVIFEEIANQLKNSDSSIDVEGYTDNQPIKTSRYPSNWQLASARAASIVQLLQGFGIAPARLSAIGYGEFRPVAENDSLEGRAKNRRVVLVLHRESIKRPIVQAIDLPRTAAIETPTNP